MEIGCVAGIIIVETPSEAARCDSAHESFLHPCLLDRCLQVVQVSLQQLLAAIANRASEYQSRTGHWRRLDQLGIEIGKLHPFPAARHRPQVGGDGGLGELARSRFAWLPPAQALIGVARPRAVIHCTEGGLPVLAVIHHIQAHLSLLVDYLGDCRTQADLASACVNPSPLLPALYISMRSTGRGKLPACVVKIRSVLRFMPSLLLHCS